MRRLETRVIEIHNSGNPSFFQFCFKSKANLNTCTILLGDEGATKAPPALGFLPFGQTGDSEVLHSAQSLLCRVLPALPMPQSQSQSQSQALGVGRSPETSVLVGLVGRL